MVAYPLTHKGHKIGKVYSGDSDGNTSFIRDTKCMRWWSMVATYKHMTNS